MAAKVDPVALEVIRNRLISIVYEMGTVLRKTAYSPNIREREDCSCVLSDSKGQIIAQAEHIPGHLGMLAVGIPALLQRFPVESWHPGDVAIFNIPEGGSHLPDIRIAVPLFAGRRLIGFSANLAHHADVGGMAPGSMPATATELIQEGINIPFVKLYERGALNRGVMDVILQNVRTPEEREGDLKAQLAAAQLGQRRAKEVVEQIGLSKWCRYVDEILNYSERLIRSKIRHHLPKGTFTASQLIDDDGIEEGPIKIQATVTIGEDHIGVDFSGTDPQRLSAVNCMWSFTVSASYFVVKAVVDPTVPVNSGCYRPITVSAPAGTIVNPLPGTAVAAGNETWQRVAEVIIAAFAKADSTLVKAPSHGCMNNIAFGGHDPDHRRPYTYYETVGGGEGGRCGKDGMDGVHVLGTNTMNTPVEVLEMSYPLRIEAYELIADSAGIGQYRGGLGIKRVWRVLDHVAVLTVNSDWIKQKPDGLEGGGQGSRTRFVINEGTDREYTPSFSKFITRLGPGETLTIYSGGGNGYGSPAKRARDLIRRDLEEEKLSAQAGRQHYGFR